jgi:hypothetical protein
VSVMAVSLRPSRERMGMGAGSRRGGTREETCRLAEEEEGGELAEHHQSRPLLRSSRQDEDEDAVHASFPVDFGAQGVGNERSCGWNSGAAQGIRTEFQAQFPRHSKHRNSGPNSGIPNSWPNSVHPNEVLRFN